MIRVMIADDHALIREGLKSVVNELPDMVIVCEADHGDAIIPQLKSHCVDVLLLDVSMPGRGFLDSMKRVKAEASDVKVLVLSIHSEEIYALRALDAGAKGYLNKQLSTEELPTAIRHVHGGDTYITSTLANLLVKDRERDASKLPHHQLTNREYSVLCLLGAGKRIKAIAVDLSISPKTVSTHRANILAKMNMESTGDLIRYAMEHQLM